MHSPIGQDNLRSRYLKAGIWDVWSIKEEAIEEMMTYHLDILGARETYLRGCMEREVGGRVMVYSGVMEGRAKGKCTLLPEIFPKYDPLVLMGNSMLELEVM